MLNEGLIVNDATALVKSEMVKQSRRVFPSGVSAWAVRLARINPLFPSMQ